MSDPANLLMLEFLSWVSSRRRTYEEVMDAWQSHCPRQTIWENAIIDGFVQLNNSPNSHDAEVVLTPRGRAVLTGHNQH